MKILVTIKPVVDVQLSIRVTDGNVVADGLKSVINAWDENALEEAMRIKENRETEVVLLTINNSDDDRIIRKALAFGADRAIRVDFDHAGADALTIGMLIAAVIQKEKPDLIICGKQAQDTDRGQCALIAAFKANLPAVANVSSLKINEPLLELERLGEDGVEMIEMPMPALATVNDSINEPRLASIKNIMAARKKPIDVLKPADVNVLIPDAYSLKTLSFTEPAAKSAGRLIEGEISAAAAEAARLLMNEAKVL